METEHCDRSRLHFRVGNTAAEVQKVLHFFASNARAGAPHASPYAMYKVACTRMGFVCRLPFPYPDRSNSVRRRINDLFAYVLARRWRTMEAICTPAQSIIRDAVNPKIVPSKIPGELRQFTWPPEVVALTATSIVAQGSAALHGLLSLPVFETNVTREPAAANGGATSKNAATATATAKSLVMILITFGPYDVTSKWRQHHCVAEPKT